ncbi:GGDEF domain-containing protein [Paenibacillus segetis]|uniref:GGDEF domain-containing protein n=1 Tax=Paenibacillus segetis TaxID=1325360 RepID=A0ABQ1Y4Z6_9BACL|nr:diguanylate cyclase [Paenibacillus segetis]GGH12544.1 GGDEF domain-containing protein [Paenibacillus segetis]
MFEGLVNNFTILTTFLFFGNMVRSKYLNEDRLNRDSNSLILGIVLGLFGVVLMYFSFPISETVFVDFRQLPILISVCLGGGTAGIVTTVIISIYRLFFLSGVNFSSELAAINAFVSFGIAIMMLRGRKLSFKRWNWSLGLTMVTADILFLITLEEDNKWFSIALFSIVYVLGGVFTYFMLQYLKRSDDLLRLMSEAANRDFLTGLFNLRAFEAFMEQKSILSLHSRTPFTLLMIDIDHFKCVNDTYGHPAGDLVLTELAEVLRDSFRPNDHIARKGGEEFVVVVDRCNREQIVMIAERLRRNVEDHVFHLPDGTDIRITVSVGCATYPDVMLDQLIERADQALYQAKESGRNRVC